jgi:hypothetical protein
MLGQVQSFARSMKLDEAAERVNKDAIVAAFSPFLLTKVLSCSTATNQRYPNSLSLTVSLSRCLAVSFLFLDLSLCMRVSLSPSLSLPPPPSPPSLPPSLLAFEVSTKGHNYMCRYKRLRISHALCTSGKLTHSLSLSLAPSLRSNTVRERASYLHTCTHTPHSQQDDTHTHIHAG